MFNNTSWKQKAGLMALGSIFTIIGMLFAIGLLPSVTAQKDKLDTIWCSRLEVVDATGRMGVVLNASENGGLVGVLNKDGILDVLLSCGIDGGSVRVSGSGGREVKLAINDYGGIINAYGEGRREAVFGINADAGRVNFFSEDGNLGVVLGNDVHGGGRLDVYHPERKWGRSVSGGIIEGMHFAGVTLTTDAHGSRVEIAGRGEGKAEMGITEHGNGAVSTWDKNGNRQ